MGNWFCILGSYFVCIVYIFVANSCFAECSNLATLVEHGEKHSRPSSGSGRGCDLFHGSWVYDPTYTLYSSSICPFIEQQFDCHGNGCPDQLYLKYKWKPTACDLPKFNGQDFLRRFKNKKIMFVGDSLSLNQWQSLTCMLHGAAPRSNFTIQRKDKALSIFTFSGYNVSIMLSRNAFLVDLVKEEMGRVLVLDSIANGDSWRGVDMLGFNTWHWWLHKGSRQPWDFIRVGNTTYKDMDRLAAFKLGLSTWARWVYSNTKPAITQVFFQGISPSHYNGQEWNASGSTTCKGQTQPLTGSVYPGGLPPAVAVVKEAIGNMSTPVSLLDITTLSQLRKDGHPSVYGSGGEKGNDCSHWCLPGVPDTWNQLLYATLVATD